MSYTAKIVSILTCVFGIATLTFGQHHGGKFKDMTPQERAEHHTKKMDQTLDLSDEQEASVLAINQKYAEQMSALREEKKKEMEAMRGQLEAIREARNAEFKEVLNEEQYAKHLEKEEKHIERIKSKMTDKRRG